MKFETELADDPLNITMDESLQSVSSILDALKAIRGNIEHRPEILYWIERALIEAENQLKVATTALH